MNQRGTTIAMTVLLMLASRLVVAQDTKTPGADPAVSVKHADLEFCRSVQERGLEGWMSYFETDAVIGPSNPPARGKDAIRAIYSKVFARQNLEFQWVPLTGEVFGSGDLGYTSGRARMSYVENGALKERTSRYVTIWAKQADGTWKVIADFGASDPSPQNVRIECK
jgi:ketosteroid isomerase-like protein